MKSILFIICLLLFKEAHTQSYRKIHRQAIVVDTHNDILMKSVEAGIVFDKDLTDKTHSDLERWKKGGLDVQLFSVYCDGDIKDAFAFANREMDSLDAIIKRNPLKIAKVSGYSELMRAVKEKKIAAMFGVEGGHMIENDLGKLEELYNRGARYLTLTHNISPAWASSAADETKKSKTIQKGLTDFGRQVINKMNELGMIIDVSHAGDSTFRDVLAISTKPVIASHSSVYNLVPHRRNLKDEQIKAIANSGGAVFINFNPGFIDSSFDRKEDAFFKKHSAETDSLKKSGMQEFYAADYIYNKYSLEADAIRPPLSLVIDHIDYVVRLAGIDHAGLGSDFDGINITPLQLNDVTAYPEISKELKKRGYTKKAIRKILGGNFLRVLKMNEKKILKNL